MPSRPPADKPRSDQATAHGVASTTQLAYDAYVADRSQDFDPLRALPRGTVVDLPLLDSIADVPIDLEKHCRDRRVVLLFYPGGWQAASHAALRAFEGEAAAFEAAEARLVAVTPELPQFARRTAAENGVSFVIAVDQACRFTRSLGLSFKLPLQIRRIVRDNGLRINNWNGEGSYNMPMPAVLILDRLRRVRWIDTAPTVDGLDPARALQALRYLETEV